MKISRNFIYILSLITTPVLANAAGWNDATGHWFSDCNGIARPSAEPAKLVLCQKIYDYDDFEQLGLQDTKNETGGKIKCSSDNLTCQLGDVKCTGSDRDTMKCTDGNSAPDDTESESDQSELASLLNVGSGKSDSSETPPESPDDTEPASSDETAAPASDTNADATSSPDAATPASAPGDTTSAPSAPSGDTGGGENSELTQAEKELSEQKIAALQENANAMHEKEQSTENKLLGGASIGAMGMGGMQTASAIAEKRADEDAERDMTAYLATFRCDFGQGRNIQGGEKEIVLPGSDQLIELKREFAELAADLKIRKEALGLRAGLESEVIIDASTTGLYDDVSLGKTDGAFTSLSRALSDPDSADAAEWAQQKADTASKLKTGVTTLAVAAVGSIAGNLLINKDAPKERSAEIIAEFDAKRAELRRKMKPVEQESERQVLQNPPTVEESKEPNPDPVPPAPATEPAPVAEPTPVAETPAPAPEPTAPVEPSVAETDCKNSGGTWANGTCTCPDGKNLTGTKCTDAPAAPVAKSEPKPSFSLYSDSLFDSGKTVLKQPTTSLDTAISALKENAGTSSEFKIVLVGHTDRDRIIQSSALCKTNKICTNDQLASARATAVQDYIKSKWTLPAGAQIITLSAGDTCARGTTKDAKAKDRKVDFYIFYEGEDTSTINKCAVASD